MGKCNPQSRKPPISFFSVDKIRNNCVGMDTSTKSFSIDRVKCCTVGQINYYFYCETTKFKEERKYSRLMKQAEKRSWAGGGGGGRGKVGRISLILEMSNMKVEHAAHGCD